MRVQSTQLCEKPDRARERLPHNQSARLPVFFAAAVSFSLIFNALLNIR
jgi:hypothetical protein